MIGNIAHQDTTAILYLGGGALTVGPGRENQVSSPDRVSVEAGTVVRVHFRSHHWT